MNIDLVLIESILGITHIKKCQVTFFLVIIELNQFYGSIMVFYAYYYTI